MKKRLLTMALTAMVAAGSYAFELGEYLYTTTAKLKVEGENLVENGTFSNLFEGGWTNETGGAISNWSISQGEGPTGEEAVVKTQSQSSEAGTILSNVWQLKAGVYAISYQVFFDAAATTNVSAATTANYINFFANSDGSATIERAIADIQSFEGQKWNLVVDTIFVNAEQEYLVFNAANLPAGTMFTDFAINKVSEVYDTRIIEKKMAYAEKLMADANFDTEAAAEAKDALAGLIELYRADIEEGNMDDVESGNSSVEELANSLTEYMDASTENITKNEYFQWVEDLTTMNKYNRKDLKGNTQYGGFMFRQDGAATGAETNWVHGTGSEYISKWILKGNTNGPGSVALYSTKMPAGKYFVAMDVRTGTAGRGSNDWSTVWDITTNAQAFVNADSAALVPMTDGERYIRIYAIGEVKEGEPLEAGVWWESMEGNNPTPEFFVTNFEIRAFGNVAEVVAHKTAWETFKAQYDAAVNARKNIADLQADKANYPWAQDSLQLALNQWDPYFNAVASWVTAEGEDAGVASTDELNDWARYQGVEAYSVNEETGEQTRLDYQVVRGYQNAVNYVKAQNQPISDLTAAIKNAEATLADDLYSTGNKAAFQAVIDNAKALLSEIQANTTDAQMEADAARITSCIEALATASDEYIASGTLAPVIDIDFSNTFEAIEEDGFVTGYVVKGNGGQMNFTDAVTVENTTYNTNYTLGFDGNLNDVLRCGKSEATVALPEIADNEVIRVQFDLWIGNLVNRFMIIELRNAAGERVAGFRLNRYNGVLDYNDFNNEANTGLDILGYTTAVGSSSASNAAICVDNNKSSFDLIIDYKAQALRGSVTNGQRGTCDGDYVAMPAVSDTKVTTFVLSSTYDNDARRSWFDNFKVLKYPSSAEGPIDTGISNVAPVKAASGAIYTIGGVKVSNASKPGLYIQNGKKFVVK